jgi:hypothetical protein
MPQLVSEHYKCNISRMTLFSKIAVRIYLDAHIGAIVVLIGGKLTGIYYLHLLYVIYYSVMTHRRKGKKLSILPPGNVNPRPIPSTRGLLEDSPYHAVGAVCLSCDWLRPRTSGVRT